MHNDLEVSIKLSLVRLAAICAGADGIDGDGKSLPFEENAIHELGNEFDLANSDVLSQIEKAKGGIASVSTEEWSSLKNLSNEYKQEILDKFKSIAAADSDFSESEMTSLAIITSKLEV